jgi:hypothetical protein
LYRQEVVQMMDYEMARERQETIRRMVAEMRRAAGVARPVRPAGLCRTAGTALARLAMRLAGPAAVTRTDS